MFWISKLFFILGLGLFVVVLVVLCSNWRPEKRGRIIRGPWRHTSYPDCDLPDLGVNGKILRGAKSWWKKPEEEDET